MMTRVYNLGSLLLLEGLINRDEPRLHNWYNLVMLFEECHESSNPCYLKAILLHQLKTLE